jgi:hypothetical protein
MPSNVVKTPEDEAHWSKAKDQVRREYSDVGEGSDRFYALTMEIFRRMKYGTGGKPAPAPLAKALPLPRLGVALVVGAHGSLHLRRDGHPVLKTKRAA